MSKGTVGAGIVSIITESLYDKPIVVFREYIQNAVDSIDTAGSFINAEDLSTQIWLSDNDLFFLDNGTGIDSKEFNYKMRSIADSDKTKTENLGYKGIGRLSGISYCSELTFINIINYKENSFQEYVVNCDKYRKLQKSEGFNNLDFDGLMSEIGSQTKQPNTKVIHKLIGKHKDMFTSSNTGFFVRLKGISIVLKSVIDDEQFLDNLGWLLPVPFLPELITEYNQDNQNYKLFTELMQTDDARKDVVIPAKSFKIFYNGHSIKRPLTNKMLRKYLCKSSLGEYAVCVHTFSNKKIEIAKGNPFSGIRIYIDNMLLCDENELIPALQQYGLIRQGGTYEVIQSVRGIGAMIFITDKDNISANARRTFIDVTDHDAFEFLELIGQFVDSIFKARYALSGYESAKRKDEASDEKLEELRATALKSLETLARSEIELKVEEKPEPAEFSTLPLKDQRRLVKNSINRQLNTKVKNYISQTDEYSLETCYSDFKTWLSAN